MSHNDNRDDKNVPTDRDAAGSSNHDQPPSDDDSEWDLNCDDEAEHSGADRDDDQTNDLDDRETSGDSSKVTTEAPLSDKEFDSLDELYHDDTDPLFIDDAEDLRKKADAEEGEDKDNDEKDAGEGEEDDDEEGEEDDEEKNAEERAEPEYDDEKDKAAYPRRHQRGDGRRHNPRIHGAHVQDHLPEEDPEDFERKHQSFRDEWKIDGVTEEEAVRSLAHSYRAVRRMERFIDEELALLAESPLQNETKIMIDLTEVLENTKRESVARQVLRDLPQSVREFLNRAYPRVNFKKPEEWIAALASAMPTLLEVHAAAAVREQADLKWRTEQAARRREVLDQTTKSLERLESRAEKSVRRLSRSKHTRKRCGPVSGHNRRLSGQLRQLVSGCRRRCSLISLCRRASRDLLCASREVQPLSITSDGLLLFPRVQSMVEREKVSPDGQ